MIKKRIIKSWRSTVLGLVLFGTAVALVFFDKAKLNETTPWVISVCGIFGVFANEKKDDGGKN